MGDDYEEEAIGGVPVSELLARIEALEAQAPKPRRVEWETDKQILDRVLNEIADENPGVYVLGERPALLLKRYEEERAKQSAEMTRVMIDTLPPPPTEAEFMAELEAEFGAAAETEAEVDDIIAWGLG